MVRTQGETHRGKSKERQFRVTRLLITGQGGYRTAGPPTNLNLKKYRFCTHDDIRRFFRDIPFNRNQPLKLADDWLYLWRDFYNMLLKSNINYI